MNRFRSFLLITVFLLLGGVAQAAVTTVTPGTGTLNAAIAGASSGDTLLLQAGDYIVDTDATIAAGLTIRAIGADTQPRVIIASSAVQIIVGTPERVVMQGLNFVDTSLSATPDITDNVPGVVPGNLQLLQNRFEGASVSLNDMRELLVVGNVFTNHGNLLSRLDVFNTTTSNGWERAVVAGNRFVAEGFLSAGALDLGTLRGGQLLGNYFECLTFSTGTSDCFSVDGADVVGNTFTSRVTNDASITHLTVQGSPEHANAAPLVANNLFQFSADGAYTDEVFQLRAIEVLLDSSQGLPVIRNNVVDYGDVVTTSADGAQAAAITLIDEASIQGNIIVNGAAANHPALFFNTAAIEANSTVTNNLCFQNLTNCGAANGNLAVDPQFANLTSYDLAGASPAINAGPGGDALSDIDLTANDMGVQGGPLPLSQFTAQLDTASSNSTQPYVYPLDIRDKAFAPGAVGIRFLSVARQR